MGTSPRLYVYKLTTDNGGAPCVTADLLSLAICKPSIRRKARKNDWIFGFGGKHLKGRLIYIARVTKPVGNGSYYKDETYEGRDDRIYRRNEDGTFELRPKAKYHKGGDHLKSDLGKPDKYMNAVALLSDDFRYWGHKGTQGQYQEFERVKMLLADLRRGHRVNLNQAQVNELCELQQLEWRTSPNKKKIGRPSDGDCSRPCNRSEGDVVHSK